MNLHKGFRLLGAVIYGKAVADYILGETECRSY